MMRSLLLFILVLAIPAALSAQDFKTWRSGNFSVEAKLVDASPTTVKLEKRDGQSINVPIAKLSNHSFAQLNLDPSASRKLCPPLSGQPAAEGLIRLYAYKFRSAIDPLIAYSKDGRYIFLTTYSSLIAISSETGQIVHEEKLPANGFNSIAVSPDGHFMALGGKIVLIWQISRNNSSRLLNRVSAFNLPSSFMNRSIAFSTDSDVVAAASSRGKVLIIDTATGNYRCEVAPEDFTSIYSCGFIDASTIYVTDYKSRQYFDINSLKRKTPTEVAEIRSKTKGLRRPTAVEKSGHFLVSGLKSSTLPIELGTTFSISGVDRYVVTQNEKYAFGLAKQRISQWDLELQARVHLYDLPEIKKDRPDYVGNWIISPCDRYFAGFSQISERLYIIQPYDTPEPYKFPGTN